MGFIKRAWTGQEKLWKAFWVYWILLGILLAVLFTFAALPLMLAALALPGIEILVNLLFLPYTVWVLVSNWRCAWNANHKIWGYIVRLFVILGVIGTIYSYFEMVSSLLNGPAAMENSMSNPSSFSSQSSTMADGSQVRVETSEHGSVKTTTNPDGSVSYSVEFNSGQMNSANDTNTQPGVGSSNLSPPSATPPSATPPGDVSAVNQPTVPPKMDACEQRMHDHAVQNNADPVQYIATNSAYLEECRKALLQGATNP